MSGKERSINIDVTTATLGRFYQFSDVYDTGEGPRFSYMVVVRGKVEGTSRKRTYSQIEIVGLDESIRSLDPDQYKGIAIDPDRVEQGEIVIMNDHMGYWREIKTGFVKKPRFIRPVKNL